ncbi:MAG: hypothetical protein ABSG68_03015 [Thermoguttaceae bacterium]|jgi:hypothetical protein
MVGEAITVLFSKVFITLRVMQFHLAERDEYDCCDSYLFADLKEARFQQRYDL